MTVSECSNLFCAECKVGWHSGIECGEFRKLKRKCKFYVEKLEGCFHILC